MPKNMNYNSSDYIEACRLGDLGKIRYTNHWVISSNIFTYGFLEACKNQRYDVALWMASFSADPTFDSNVLSKIFTDPKAYPKLNPDTVLENFWILFDNKDYDICSIMAKCIPKMDRKKLKNQNLSISDHICVLARENNIEDISIIFNMFNLSPATNRKLLDNILKTNDYFSIKLIHGLTKNNFTKDLEISFEEWIVSSFTTACGCGYFETSKWLIDEYGQVIINNINNGNINLTELFINLCIDNSSNKNMIEWLRSLGKIENLSDTFCRICVNRNSQLIEWFLNNMHIDINKKVFISICKINDINLTKKIYQLCKNNNKHLEIITNSEDIFYELFNSNSLETIKWLYDIIIYEKMPFDIHYNNESLLLSAIASNNIYLVKFIILLGENLDDIVNIHVDNEKPFIMACKNGNIEIVKYLWTLGLNKYSPIDIHAQGDEAFDILKQMAKKDQKYQDIYKWLICKYCKCPHCYNYEDDIYNDNSDSDSYIVTL